MSRLVKDKGALESRQLSNKNSSAASDYGSYSFEQVSKHMTKFTLQPVTENNDNLTNSSSDELPSDGMNKYENYDDDDFAFGL